MSAQNSSASAAARPAAFIAGCAGIALGAEERAFFRDADPLGLILFARNCQEPGQIRALVAAFRDCVGREAPVLIDQEGGRVARLKPPQWRVAPAAARFAALAADDPESARAAVRLNARLIAADLCDLGITVDCAPVVDVPRPDADGIIGDRAYGSDPLTVAELAGAACEGFLEGGVLPVIKHIPGHGRARVDSHHALPVVEADEAALRAGDFSPFRALRGMPWGMTAHVVYTAFDADRPATTSPRVIAEVIRGWIGFDGFLVSDDLSMKALGGSFAERTALALDAGCDAVLHCNGDLGEMTAVANACRPLDDDAFRRFQSAEALRMPPQPLDREVAVALLDGWMRERNA